MDQFKVPILLLVFNRPEETAALFKVIQRIKPTKLYIACDGPRSEMDEVQLKKVKCVFDFIDWECNVQTRYLTDNKGCKMAVSSAIDWFFSLEEMGIILEDDCIPDDSFFPFCEQLLMKYQDNHKVWQICGYNALGKVKDCNSYYFSKYGPIWGWATWKRAWEKYDVEIKNWPILKESKAFREKFANQREWKWREHIFDKIYNNQIDTWDYQWAFSKIAGNGLSIIPSINLVNNIGFNERATHTKFSVNLVPSGKLSFPLIEPKTIEANVPNDLKYLTRVVFKPKWRKVFPMIKSILTPLFKKMNK